MDGICLYKSSPRPTFFLILQVSNSYQKCFFLTLINHSKELTFCDYNPEKRTSFVPCKTHAFPVFSTIVIRNASYLQSKKKIFSACWLWYQFNCPFLVITFFRRVWKQKTLLFMNTSHRRICCLYPTLFKFIMRW